MAPSTFSNWTNLPNFSTISLLHSSVKRLITWAKCFSSCDKSFRFCFLSLDDEKQQKMSANRTIRRGLTCSVLFLSWSLSWHRQYEWTNGISLSCRRSTLPRDHPTDEWIDRSEFDGIEHRSPRWYRWFFSVSFSREEERCFTDQKDVSSHLKIN